MQEYREIIWWTFGITLATVSTAFVVAILALVLESFRERLGSIISNVGQLRPDHAPILKAW